MDVVEIIWQAYKNEIKTEDRENASKNIFFCSGETDGEADFQRTQHEKELIAFVLCFVGEILNFGK